MAEKGKGSVLRKDNTHTVEIYARRYFVVCVLLGEKKANKVCFWSPAL